jgi:hypothetical protein
MRLIFAFLLLVALTACDRSAPKVAGPAQPVVQDVDEFPVPQAARALQAEIEAMTPVALVPFEKLLPFLPPAPDGFTAEKADGEVIDRDDEKYTIVGRDYRKADNYFVVTIVDAGRAKAKYRPILRWVDVVDETPDDYTKGVVLEGNPGWEHYDRKFKSGNLHLMIGKRYLLTVHLSGLDREVMHTVYKSIDIKGLAALK